MNDGEDKPAEISFWSALDSAKKNFGVKEFFPHQRTVISNILEAAEFGEKNKNRSHFASRQIVLLPTGAGKSLCFLSPALVLHGITLVIYPLLALIADQKRRLDECNIPCVVFRGGQSAEERDENFRKLHDGAKIVLATPESLQNESLLQKISEAGVDHVAIDEAHCVSEWGETFRPSYLSLGKIIGKINPPVATAFTATASDEVLEKIRGILFDGKCSVLRGECDRKNIRYRVIKTYAKTKTALLLSRTEEKPMVIFCGTRKNSQNMAREIRAHDESADVNFYHAGMTRKEKEDVEKKFFASQDGILCCTCAFGMGVDKKNIRTVIHLEPGNSAESFVQESGRGGRDGKPANSILLWNWNDESAEKNGAEKKRFDVIKKFAAGTECRRQILLDELGGKKTECSGCDVCENSVEKFPRDAEEILRLVQKFSGRFSREELLSQATNRLNEISAAECGEKIYDVSDADEIISQLEKQNLISQKTLQKKFTARNSTLTFHLRPLLQTMRNFRPASIF